jgi:hypothetical protein
VRRITKPRDLTAQSGEWVSCRGPLVSLNEAKLLCPYSSPARSSCRRPTRASTTTSSLLDDSHDSERAERGRRKVSKTMLVVNPLTSDIYQCAQLTQFQLIPLRALFE